MYTDHVRRHPDGSIDFDFYRRRAARRRAQAMRRLVSRVKLYRNPLVGVALLAAIAMAIATPGTLGERHPPDAGLAGQQSAQSGRG
jgi:hypothetical protein